MKFVLLHPAKPIDELTLLGYTISIASGITKQQMLNNNKGVFL